MMKKVVTSFVILVILFIVIIGCGTNDMLDSSMDTTNEQNALVHDDEFPIKPIQIVVPYAAGGGTDKVARAIAHSASKYFNEPINVVNRLGQGGARGIKESIYANNDGYTVALLTVEISSLPALNLMEEDYTMVEPIILLNSEPGLLVVNKDFPCDTLEELIEYANEKGNSFSVGSAGKGSIWNIAAIGIEDKIELDFEHVYYDGASYAVMDVLGGNTDMVIAGLSEVIVHLQAGELKVLTALADERIDEISGVKTFKESGYDFSIATWRGLSIPKNVDEDIKNMIIENFTDAALDVDFIQTMEQLNLYYDYKDTEEFAKYLENDYFFFKDITKDIALE